MDNFKDIAIKDSKDRYHGYQQWYYRNIYTKKTELSVRGNLKHDIMIGYVEIHEYETTRFYIK